jgi:hypothetical protein
MILRLISSVFLMLILAACNGSNTGNDDDTGDNIALKWNEDLLTAVRNAKLGPPMNARGFAVVYTAAYDAWALYDAEAKPVHSIKSGNQLAQDEQRIINQQKAVSYAIYKAALDIFPTQKSVFDQSMQDLGYAPTLDAEAGSPEAVGLAAADAVLAFKHRDGSNQKGDLAPGAYSDYTGYQPSNSPDQLSNPGRWQPLRVTNAAGVETVQKFLVPHWGRVKTFGIASGSAVRAEPPFDVNSEDFELEMQEVIDINANLGDREKVIAEYWAGGPGSETPPGHWMLLTNSVVRRDNLEFDDTIKLFFLMGNALSDASVACWDTKRVYDTVRPISIIRERRKGQTIKGWGGPNKGIIDIQGQNWQPYQEVTFVTPPFGEYTSGHSTFSAASAEILKLFTGSDHFGESVVIKAGSMKIESNVPAKDTKLHWDTFTDAAEQAGISRLYGGIHFQSGNRVGQRMGRTVAQQVWNRAQELFN